MRLMGLFLAVDVKGRLEEEEEDDGIFRKGRKGGGAKCTRD